MTISMTYKTVYYVTLRDKHHLNLWGRPRKRMETKNPGYTAREVLSAIIIPHSGEARSTDKGAHGRHLQGTLGNVYLSEKRYRMGGVSCGSEPCLTMTAGERKAGRWLGQWPRTETARPCPWPLGMGRQWLTQYSSGAQNWVSNLIWTA